MVEFGLEKRMTEMYKVLHKKQNWYHRIINYFDFLFSSIKELFLYILIPFCLTYVILLFILSILLRL